MLDILKMKGVTVLPLPLVQELLLKVGPFLRIRAINQMRNCSNLSISYKITIFVGCLRNEAQAAHKFDNKQ